MKKTISLLLALIMLASSLFALSIPAYAYSAHTQSESVEWAKQRVGVKTGNGECVALIKEYYNYLGVEPVSGNGCDYATNALPVGWQRIPYSSGFVAQPGDIAVWTWNAWAGNYGHVAIVTSADSSRMNYVDQGKSYGYVGHEGSVSYTDSNWKFFGVIRPDFLPIKVSKFSITELMPNKVKFDFNISNSKKLSIEKRKVGYRKQGATSWKVNTKTYSTPFTGGIKVTNVSIKSLDELTNYEIRISVYVDSKWEHIYYTNFSTPAKTSISSASVPSSSAKYTGDNISTSSLLSVSVNGKTLANGTDYTVSPSTVKEIGRYSVTVSGINWYKDSVTTTITIYPKTPTIKSVSYSKTTGRIKLKWARVANCSYQQVAISKSSKFESSKTCIIREDQPKQSASFYKLKFNGKIAYVTKGETYYIRMRAYKIVNGEKIYGKWGAKRTITCN